MIEQDPNARGGVAHLSACSKPAIRARNRKANAAVALRIGGASWGEIAELVGYSSPRAALVAAETQLEKELLDTTDRTELRRLASRRLERLLASVWSKALDPNAPEHLTAVTKAREIIAQHAKLHGLDAPTEVVLRSPAASEIEGWVAQMLGTSDYEEDDIVDAEEMDGDDEGEPLGGELHSADLAFDDGVSDMQEDWVPVKLALSAGSGADEAG